MHMGPFGAQIALTIRAIRAMLRADSDIRAIEQGPGRILEKAKTNIVPERREHMHKHSSMHQHYNLHLCSDTDFLVFIDSCTCGV